MILTLLTQNNKTQVAVSKILPLTNLAALVCLGYQSNTSQKTIYKEEEEKKNKKTVTRIIEANKATNK